MYRFYGGDVDLRQAEIAVTDKDELRHIRTVLRLKKGATVIIFNDRQEEGTGVILDIQPRRITLRVKAVRKIEDTAADIFLACAIPKKAKFESIIEKCTELGVRRIMPLLTRRTDVKLKGEKAARKHDRYCSVARNASKQSGRAALPQIDPVTPFSDGLAAAKADGYTILIPHLHDRRKPLKDILPSITGKVAVFIGPEGDFTPQEIEEALEHGALPVSLGRNVLKVDTAAISAAAFIILSLNS